MDFWAVLAAELAAWSVERPATLWWRDDDTAAPGPSLDRLLRLSADAAAPLALAVVPRDMAPDLRASLAQAPQAMVIQHGYAHVNHAPTVAGAGAWELGPHRPTGEVADELSLGLDQLRESFGPRFHPILVPPWNRIDDAVVRLLPGLGYAGLSLFGPRPAAEAAGRLRLVNTHYDPIHWRKGRRFTGLDFAAIDLVGHLRQRRLGEVEDEPTGILTHHWALDDEAWRFLEALIPRLQRCPTARLLPATEVFHINGLDSSRVPALGTP